jgi:hypothetical protein
MSGLTIFYYSWNKYYVKSLICGVRKVRGVLGVDHVEYNKAS